jgi:hypothetical protein
MTTTFRQDVVAGLLDILTSFRNTNPAMLRRVEAVEPPSVVGDLPLAFISGRTERVTHDSGIRQRVMTPAVIVVSQMAANEETVTSHDVLVDALLDHFTSYPHVIPATSANAPRGDIWDEMTIDDEDYPVASADGTIRHFYATRFTFGNLSIQEGRV